MAAISTHWSTFLDKPGTKWWRKSESERSRFAHHHTRSTWHERESMNSACHSSFVLLSKKYLYCVHTLHSQHLKSQQLNNTCSILVKRFWWLPCLPALPYGAMLLAGASSLTLLLKLQAALKMMPLWFVSTEMWFNVLVKFSLSEGIALQGPFEGNINPHPNS